MRIVSLKYLIIILFDNWSLLQFEKFEYDIFELF